MPQGSILGPLLVLVYMNVIAKHIFSLIRLFADECLLVYAAEHIADLGGIINHDLQLLTNWTRQLLVTLNPLKIEAVLFLFKNRFLATFCF